MAIELEDVAAAVEAVVGAHMDAFYRLQLTRARAGVGGLEQGPDEGEMVAEV